MGERDRRIEEIQDAAHSHPLIHVALNALEEDGESLKPSPVMAQTLTSKLKELDRPESFLAAVLGLADLAFVLQEKHGAAAASEAIIGALAQQQPRIDECLLTLPGDAGALGKLRNLKKDDYGQQKVEAGPTLNVKGSHVSNAGFDLGAPSKKR